MTLFVGLGHRKRVGKDTISNLLVSALDREWLKTLRVGFADKLKDLCETLYGQYGMKHRTYYDSCPEFRSVPLATCAMTPRDIWIQVGQAMRSVWSDVWVRAVLDDPWYRQHDVVVIPDTRFINEVMAIKTLGGIVVKIEKDDVPVTHDAADDALSEFTGWDMVFHNNTPESEILNNPDFHKLVGHVKLARFKLQI